MPEDLEKRVREAIRNHRRMGDSKREAVTTTAETFEDVSLDQIEKIADQIYGEEKKPELMAAEEEGESGGEGGEEPEPVQDLMSMGPSGEGEGKMTEEEKEERKEFTSKLSGKPQTPEEKKKMGKREAKRKEEQELREELKEDIEEEEELVGKSTEELKEMTEEGGPSEGEEEEMASGRCPNCKSEDIEWQPDKETYICNDCGNEFEASEKLPEEERGKAAEGFAAHLKGSVPKIGFITAVIIIVGFGLPLLGFGGLAYALTIVGVISLLLEHIFPMRRPFTYIKPFFRTLGFTFLSFGLLLFFGDRPVFRMIPLVIAGTGILTYPSGITSEERGKKNFEKVMSTMRTFYGFILVIIFLWTFKSTWTTWQLGASFAFLSLAFFFVFPKLGGFGEGTSDEIGKAFAKAGSAMGEGVKKKLGGGPPSLVIFLPIWFAGIILPFVLLKFGLLKSVVIGTVLAIGFYWLYKVARKGHYGAAFSGICGLVGLLLGAWALVGSTVAVVIFSSVVFLGLMTAVPLPEARPVMGMIILPMAVMAATAAYPSVMGEAVFGGWWPTVYSRVRGVQRSMGPMMQQFGQVQTSLGRGWTCLASPQECYKIYKPNTQVEESYASLSFTELSPMGIPRITAPPDKVDGGYEFKAITTLENQLQEEKINNIEVSGISLKRLSKKKNPQEKEDVATVGSAKISGGECWKEETCTISKLLPGSTRQLTLDYRINGQVPPGGYVQYGARAEFDISTSATLDIEILSEEEWKELSKAGKLSREEKTSTFRWGPVSIGVSAARKQPLKEGWTVPVTLSFENRGQGAMTGAPTVSFEHSSEKLQSELNDCKKSLEKGLRTSFDNKKVKIGEGSDGKSIEGLPEGEHLLASCSITLPKNLPPEGVAKRTVGLTADASYTYQISRTNFIEVLYGCVDDGDCGDKCCINSSTGWTCGACEQ